MKLNSNSSAARVKIGFGKAWLCRQIIDSQQIAGGDCDFGCYCDFDCDLDSWRCTRCCYWLKPGTGLLISVAHSPGHSPPWSSTFSMDVSDNAL